MAKASIIFSVILVICLEQDLFDFGMDKIFVVHSFEIKTFSTEVYQQAICYLYASQ